MVQPKIHPYPVIILGMHRAGTSLVAGMLHKMGISMGTSFLSPDENNPHGYFEDLDFLWINKGLLENAGGSWKQPPSIDDLLGMSKKFHNIIRETIQRKQGASTDFKWGWKDPRNCFTCWIYSPHVQNARYIVVVRDFAGIQKSLEKTHGNGTDWNKLIKSYYDSVDTFLLQRKNDAINVIFDKIVNEKYSANVAEEIAYFVGTPKKVKAAIRFIQPR
jgi:hypothetical protein